ncbi:MAG: LCP family protein [Actinomycetota bacterium]|nr:LCP family protein [Actinomycetota bacterium]
MSGRHEQPDEPEIPPPVILRRRPSGGRRRPGTGGPEIPTGPAAPPADQPIDQTPRVERSRRVPEPPRIEQGPSLQPATRWGWDAPATQQAPRIEQIRAVPPPVVPPPVVLPPVELPLPVPAAEPVARTSGRVAVKEGQRRRTRDRRRRRLRRTAVLGVLLIVLGGVAAGYSVLHRDRNGRGYHLPVGPHLRTQRTLLFEVRDAHGAALCSAVLAHDPAQPRGAVVVVPSRVLTQLPGGGTQPFGDVLKRPDGPLAARQAVADLLGIRVDSSWVLDAPAFARLVDYLGGTAGADPGQQLTGAQTLALLAPRGTGEDELARLPRVQQVLAAVLAKLPSSAEGVGRLADVLGTASQVSDALVMTSLLDGLRTDFAARRVSVATLPVLAVNSGGAQTFRLEIDGVTRLVGQALAGSALASHPSRGNRVLVINQAAASGTTQKVREKLVAAGFVVAGIRDQPPLDRPHTAVLVFDPASRTRAGRLAAALGVPEAPVQVVVRAQSIADLIVLVGRDASP